MQDNMSISVNGQTQVPPGFRFHPTEEELLQYYLKKKVAQESIDLDVIRDVDLNRLEPWDIQEKCRIGSTPQNDWYFFSHKDKKYPTGTRTNRATTAGFWKATGRDKVIYSNSRRIGMRKTLVFYKGRAPHGQKSDWIMHEYRLDDTNADASSVHIFNDMGEPAQEEGWVICRIFKKKNQHKLLDCPASTISCSSTETRGLMVDASDEGTLEQILQYAARPCKVEDEAAAAAAAINATRFLTPDHVDRFSMLPFLESPNSPARSQPAAHMQALLAENDASFSAINGVNDWAALDRLIASHLNNGGQNDSSKQFFSFSSDHSITAANFIDQDPQLLRSVSSSTQDYHHHHHHHNNECDLWSFARPSSSSSADHQLGHVSNVPV